MLDLVNNLVGFQVAHEIGHVEIQHGILVQVLLERRVAGYFQVGEQPA